MATVDGTRGDARNLVLWRSTETGSIVGNSCGWIRFACVDPWTWTWTWTWSDSLICLWIDLLTCSCYCYLTYSSIYVGALSCVLYRLTCFFGAHRNYSALFSSYICRLLFSVYLLRLLLVYLTRLLPGMPLFPLPSRLPYDPVGP